MRQALKKRLAEELAPRGTPVNTQRTYCGCIDRFERHHGTAATRLGRAVVHERDVVIVNALGDILLVKARTIRRRAHWPARWIRALVGRIHSPRAINRLAHRV